MEYSLFYSGMATLDDLQILNGIGYSFVIEDGCITHVLDPGEDE